MLMNTSNPNAPNNVPVSDSKAMVAGCGNSSTGNFSQENKIDVALTSDYCHQNQHSHQLM